MSLSQMGTSVVAPPPNAATAMQYAVTSSTLPIAQQYTRQPNAGAPPSSTGAANGVLPQKAIDQFISSLSASSIGGGGGGVGVGVPPSGGLAPSGSILPPSFHQFLSDSKEHMLHAMTTYVPNWTPSEVAQFMRHHLQLSNAICSQSIAADIDGQRFLALTHDQVLELLLMHPTAQWAEIHRLLTGVDYLRKHYEWIRHQTELQHAQRANLRSGTNAQTLVGHHGAPAGGCAVDVAHQMGGGFAADHHHPANVVTKTEEGVDAVAPPTPTSRANLADDQRKVGHHAMDTLRPFPPAASASSVHSSGDGVGVSVVDRSFSTGGVGVGGLGDPRPSSLGGGGGGGGFGGRNARSVIPFVYSYHEYTSQQQQATLRAHLQLAMARGRLDGSSESGHHARMRATNMPTPTLRGVASCNNTQLPPVRGRQPQSARTQAHLSQYYGSQSAASASPTPLASNLARPNRESFPDA